ncbi:MAG: hypothetical protein JKY02_01155 [Flavobacteriaceae bacterium]|nr:hypothetical protein [Flavobacteriaceae bacterium]
MRNKGTYFLLISCFFISVNSIAQIKKDTLKILFVGNSYTYFESMPQMVSQISGNTKTKLITRKSTVGGAKLSQHWRGVRGLKTKEIIQKGTFDIVVLQDHSMMALNAPDSLRKYAKLFSDFIKKHNVTPYFYLTWARKSTPKRQAEITKVYTEIANTNNAVLVPVGEAWALAQKSRPSIQLYHSDGSHPSKLGAYLTASVFVAVLSKEVPKSDGENDKNPISIATSELLFSKKIATSFILKK